MFHNVEHLHHDYRWWSTMMFFLFLYGIVVTPVPMLIFDTTTTPTTTCSSSDRCMLVMAATTPPPRSRTTTATTTTSIKPILLLDVDNTLYDNRWYRIEQQIISSIHQFVLHHHIDDRSLNLLPTTTTTTAEVVEGTIIPAKIYEQATVVSNHLHYEYGSTIDGLVHLLRAQHTNNHSNHDADTRNIVRRKVTQLQKEFYTTVYHPSNIDYSRLLLRQSDEPELRMYNTGYGHHVHSSSLSSVSTATMHDGETTIDKHQSYQQDDDDDDGDDIQQPQNMKVIRQLLQSMTKTYQIQLASNSPIRHVQTIVQAMGLCRLFTNMNENRVYTPDALSTIDDDNHHRHHTDDDDQGNTTTRIDRTSNYPTKLQPLDFFHMAPFRRNDPNHHYMIDDSLRVCQTIQRSLPMINMIYLSYNSNTSYADEVGGGVPSLLHALCVVMGWLPQRHKHTSSQLLPQQLNVDSATITPSGQQQLDTDNDDEVPYEFNDVQYLQHKNIVDLQSIHVPTYHRMLNEVVDNMITRKDYNINNNSAITIVDVGAGTLFMLKILLNESSGSCMVEEESRLSSLLSRLRQLDSNSYNSNGDVITLHNNSHQRESSSFIPKRIDYYAYEPNEKLYDACHQQLIDLDFVVLSDEYCVQPYSAAESTNNNNKKRIRVLMYQKSIILSSLSAVPPTIITVYLCFCDFQRISTSYEPSTHLPSDTERKVRIYPSIVGRFRPIYCPDLIVGCCFADLFDDPDRLIASLLRLFGTRQKTSVDSESDDIENLRKHLILYFPITFTGTTSAHPSQPFEAITCKDGSEQNIPSDTFAFNYYAEALMDVHHHNLDHYSIMESVENYGGDCLQQGASNWVVHPKTNQYLWETMMFFFGTAAAPIIQHHGWCALGWLQRLHYHKPTIRVNNVDLLFRIPLLGQWEFPHQRRHHLAAEPYLQELNSTLYDEILFMSPYKVSCLKKEVELLQPNQVRIQSECSLISSGTELKIFKGDFDDEALLDTTIQDFNQETMSYPLSYGYSLVGRVVACGSTVDDADTLFGRRVFTFSAHASQVTTDRSSIHIVPDDIDAIDAIFMPSVETALSLVQDARPIAGENIAIYGQGLIGLLVTAVLHHQYDNGVAESSRGKFGTITSFDTIPDRLAVSARMGASQALLPTLDVGPFDVVLEVSGNRRALQMAIDTTCHGGRVIVGSWYGCDEISLKLGIDFHRSHKSIKASQVSEIPAELSKTWTKERRFALTWAFVKQIRPSRLLSLRTTLDNAQNAYTALDNGDEIAVAFEYNTAPKK